MLNLLLVLELLFVVGCSVGYPTLRTVRASFPLNVALLIEERLVDPPQSSRAQHLGSSLGP